MPREAGAHCETPQDFVRYPFSAADNVGVGAVDRLDDREALRQAAADAGALAMIEGLARGWETTLDPTFGDGVELSGGQWQLIALSRAMLAASSGAGILVLDEPTAHLDVRAEAAFYDRFLAATTGLRAGSETTCAAPTDRAQWPSGIRPTAAQVVSLQPLTTVVISHRFSTVRRAEHIVVLDGGGVVESGGHDDLVALGGCYARMFSLQAGRFAEAAVGDV